MKEFEKGDHVVAEYGGDSAARLDGKVDEKVGVI